MGFRYLRRAGSGVSGEGSGRRSSVLSGVMASTALVRKVSV